MEILGYFWFFHPGLGVPTVLYGLFWLWMLIECIQNDPQRDYWLWILLIIPFPGALVYFFVRRGRMGFSLPAFTGRWARGREIKVAEAEARAIGNAYQFVQLGDLLLETRQFQRAAAAYLQALQQEPKNEEALWGAVRAGVPLKRYADAKAHLETLLAVDPKFKFGEPSLVYGRTLMALGDKDGAARHLTKHVESWPQPEAKVLLASLLAENGERDKARQLCQDVLDGLSFSPTFNRDQTRALQREARRVMRGL